MRRALSGLVVALGIAAGFAGPAWAHAHLVKSDPPVGSSTAPIDTLHLTFSEGIEIKFSKFEVTGADGKDVGTVKAALDPGDDKVVAVTLPAKLAVGAYTVHWHVVSVDTHHTEGTFPITVTP
jgi:methionine-rich copper-binding protein CopC